MSDQENKDFHRSESHRYWANAIGFTALCLLLIFVAKGCNETIQKANSSDHKTEQDK